MANARYQSNGIDLMIDGLQHAGENPGDIRERLWKVAWARGYSEVMVPIQVPDLKIDGHCVLSQQFAHRAMVVIDDGEQLVGVVDEKLEAPALGSRCRILPLYGASSHWSVQVMATLGCGLSIRFDDDRIESGWVDRLKACLHAIRETELTVRRQIENDRQNIVFVLPPQPFRIEMEKADKEIRERVTSGGYTEDEMKMLARAKNDQNAANKVVEIRNKRLVDAYRTEVTEFRARMPELRAEYDKKMEAYAEYRKHVDRCNETDSASRGITDMTLRASASLDAIERAVLNVHAGGELVRVEENPRRYYSEIVQTIDLLFELLPKHVRDKAVSQSVQTA